MSRRAAGATPGQVMPLTLQYAGHFIWVDPIPTTVLEISPLNADLLPPNLLVRN